MRFTDRGMQSCKCSRGAPPRFPPRARAVSPAPPAGRRRGGSRDARALERETRGFGNSCGSNIATIHARRARPRGLSRLERARGAPRGSRASGQP